MRYYFIIYGPPASGKGYLCERLIKGLKNEGRSTLYISTGDLIREEIKSQSDLGKEIEQIVQSGKLVSDEIVGQLLEKAICKDADVKIIDGYPRTEPQMDHLFSLLKKENCVIAAIYRNTPIEVIKERIAKRRVCGNCKATHSTDDGNCCPKCGGPSLIRKDDNMETLETRLAEFTANTKPLWKYLYFVCHDALEFEGSKEAEECVEYILKRFF